MVFEGCLFFSHLFGVTNQHSLHITYAWVIIIPWSIIKKIYIYILNFSQKLLNSNLRSGGERKEKIVYAFSFKRKQGFEIKLRFIEVKCTYKETYPFQVYSCKNLNKHTVVQPSPQLRCRILHHLRKFTPLQFTLPLASAINTGLFPVTIFLPFS